MYRFYAFASLIATSVVFASAANAADTKTASAALVESGHAFALKVCWACHVVATDQTQTPILTHPAPSFLVIAQKPDLTAASLRQFLGSHTKMLGDKNGMPNPQLADYQINEVVAYIESLKK
ncbi:MAG: c-type cytochrome [Methylovirgula sp.]